MLRKAQRANRMPNQEAGSESSEPPELSASDDELDNDEEQEALAEHTVAAEEGDEGEEEAEEEAAEEGGVCGMAMMEEEAAAAPASSTSSPAAALASSDDSEKPRSETPSQQPNSISEPAAHSALDDASVTSASMAASAAADADATRPSVSAPKAASPSPHKDLWARVSKVDCEAMESRLTSGTWVTEEENGWLPPICCLAPEMGQVTGSAFLLVAKSPIKRQRPVRGSVECVARNDIVTVKDSNVRIPPHLHLHAHSPTPSNSCNPP